MVATALSFPALTLAGFSTSVGVNPDALIRWLLDHGLRIVIIMVAAYLVIRIGTASAGRFEREMSLGTGMDVVERTKRAQTLGRLLQKSLSIVVMGIAALMVLRELDVDITPVLTGAGIVGLAVGFGAQTLVRDIISGFFLILEDQVRVGDVAVVNGQGGLVEEVNLRTIVLRDETGTVHVFPNGEVKTLANSSKDFSFYVITVSVPFDEDPDAVASAMRDAAAGLIDRPRVQAAHPRAAGRLRCGYVGAGNADHQGTDQDRALEAVARRAGAAETDCKGVRGTRNSGPHPADAGQGRGTEPDEPDEPNRPCEAHPADSPDSFLNPVSVS